MFALLCSLKGPEGALVLGAQLTGWEQRRGPEATPGPFCRGPRKATGGRGDVLGGGFSPSALALGVICTQGLSSAGRP